MSNKKSDEEINLYMQGAKLGQEIVDIMTEQKTGYSVAEQKTEYSVEELTNFMLSNKNAEEFVATISDTKKFASKYDEAKCGDGTDQVAKLVSRLKAKKRRSTVKIRLVRLISSVAAILIISPFILNNMEQTRLINEPKLVSASIVNTSINTPVLIKGNGLVIDLLQESSTKESVVDISRIVSYAQFEKLEYCKPVEIDRIIVPRGFTYHYMLSDSTLVYLNAGSELSFPSRFDAETREVTLTGEAFFKVQKGTKPFIVNTNYAKIKVYGTEFNVNTDINGMVETVLLSGSVGITYKDKEEVKIAPNQLISYNLDNGKCDIENVNADAYIGWISGYFIYENGSFDRIIADLSAWYGVEIYASSELLCSIKLSFSLGRNIPIERMFEIIEKIADIKFIKERGGRYIIE